MIKKIVVIGPECTGKSTLCATLAKHFQTAWCPEYAREYLLQNEKSYTYPDILTIAQGQICQEEAILKTLPEDAPFYFIDTDMYIMKIWSEFVFGRCPYEILREIATRHYDFYLLCQNDLPWVADELRECPDENIRTQLYHMYKDLLIQQHVPWAIIRGNESERLHRAIEAIIAL